MTITIRIPGDKWKFLAAWHQFKTRIHRAWRLATVRGVAGISYFDPRYDWDVAKVLLNWKDVTNRAAECDTSAGWVRLYEVDEDGAITSPPRLRYHYGRVKVEKRKPFRLATPHQIRERDELKRKFLAGELPNIVTEYSSQR